MTFLSRRVFGIAILIVSIWFQADGSSAPTNISALANAHGHLFAGTWSGKIFFSPDSGLNWTDVSFGLCDSSLPAYQKSIKCLNVTENDSIHAITSCGEFVSAVLDIQWKQQSTENCWYQFCPTCEAIKYTAHVNEWMIAAGITGPIEWSSDSAKTWTIAVQGCSFCSMPIINCLYFDTISALIGFNRPGRILGYTSNIIASFDSGRTWNETGLSDSADITSITRIGAIAFAGAENGIYASRDNFATWWLIVESQAAIKRIATMRPMAVETKRKAGAFTLSGKRILFNEPKRTMQVVIEYREDWGRMAKRLSFKTEQAR